MIVKILLLIVGFVLLIKGADLFIDGAASTAQNFKVPKLLIGLTIIAFGTSAPEFAVSMNALAKGSADIVLGNVIGSNITNTLLILGVGALISPILIKRDTLKKELPITLLISTLLVILFLDVQINNATLNQITRSDGIIIILFFTIFVYYLVAMAKNERHDKVEKPKWKLWKSILFVILGLAAIVFGSDLIVNNATGIARNLGISERIISLTIIALGTSLPELITTIVSSKKGEQDLLVGNIIGSNIFNICVVLGIPVAIYGGITQASFQSVDLIALIASVVLLTIFSTTHNKITRLEGALLVIGFIAYYVLIFVL